jgi:class 3 adenylate cyclase
MAALTPGYSALDRFLHRLALGNLELQKSLADLESRLHAKRLKQIAVDRPVFITSLPRAGTTLLLEVVNATGRFAAQTYRDMPFVLCPLLWRALSRGFRRAAEARERAHGDGMTVGYDSAEAFEEVLWKAFWPQKYAADRIVTWSRADRDREFEQAFASHIRKVIAAHGAAEGDGEAPRYVSKNNANIARLPLLAEIFPDCAVIIPFRNPTDHAGSLARQHANFLARHAADPFAQTYMEWLGHYEFGKAFRPIAFRGESIGSPEQPEYWVDYWDRAFRYMLRHAPPQALFVDYDRLCANAPDELGRIADALRIPRQALQRQAERFRPTNHYPPDAGSPSRSRAGETYATLQRRAIGAPAGSSEARAS